MGLSMPTTPSAFFIFRHRYRRTTGVGLYICRGREDGTGIRHPFDRLVGDVGNVAEKPRADPPRHTKVGNGQPEIVESHY